VKEDKNKKFARNKINEARIKCLHEWRNLKIYKIYNPFIFSSNIEQYFFFYHFRMQKLKAILSRRSKESCLITQWTSNQAFRRRGGELICSGAYPVSFLVRIFPVRECVVLQYAPPSVPRTETTDVFKHCLYTKEVLACNIYYVHIRQASQYKTS